MDEMLLLATAATSNPADLKIKQYLVGYVVEKSLTMDNIFVIALIFTFFAVPAKYQHRVLFWGIIGALVMRGGMIFLGAGLILEYQWILIVFGGFLILTALKTALIKSNDDVSQNSAVRLCKRFYRVTELYDGQKSFTKRTLEPTCTKDAAGKEGMDPATAGSLSAAWAITPDPFIVFTSNIFAILGLRALYFSLVALPQSAMRKRSSESTRRWEEDLTRM